MKQANDMEVQLWNYIDGLCTADEANVISTLIENDEAWKNTYQRLIDFELAMQTELEAEHPSMRFTQNLMEKIESMEPAHSLRTMINIWVIRAIASFMVIATLVSIIILFKTDTSTSQTATSIFPKIAIQHSITDYISGNAIASFSGFAIIITLLVLFDRYRSYRLQMDAAKK